MEVGEEGDHMPIATLNDFCIKVGSNESHLMFHLK